MYRRTIAPPPPPQEFVKLVSAEGAEFWVDRKCAMVSGTIKAMLSGVYMTTVLPYVHVTSLDSRSGRGGNTSLDNRQASGCVGGHLYPHLHYFLRPYFPFESQQQLTCRAVNVEMRQKKLSQRLNVVCCCPPARPSRLGSARLGSNLFRFVPGGFGEAASGQVHFAEISTPILEKVIQFVYYKVRD